MFLSNSIISTFANLRAEDKVIEITGTSCCAFANIIAKQLDSSGLKDLKIGMEDSEYYQQTKSVMQELATYWGVKYIYTLYVDDGIVKYGIDADSEEPYSIGTQFEEDYDYLKDVFTKGVFLYDKDFSKVDEMYLLSIYVPIYNGEEIVSILGVDFDCSAEKQWVLSQHKVTGTVNFVSIIIMNLVVGLCIYKILQNIFIVNDKIEEIVDSNGDLTKEINIKSGDEVENLSNSLNRLLAYIKDIITNINNNSEELKQVAEQLSKDVFKSQENSTNISATMEEMSAASEETAASIEEILESTKRINESMKEFLQKAQESKSLVDKLTSESEKLYKSSIETKETSNKNADIITNNVQEKIEQSKAVKEIESLTNTILEIASQTNLLSLNASIEAARAGEHGRGFAVVAGEIGKLAKDSADAANRIQEVSKIVIDSVDSLTEETNKMITFIKEDAMKGYDILLETSKNNQMNMSQIHDTMVYVEKETISISNTINEIDQNLDAISIAVDENAKGVTEVTSAIVDLTGNIASVDASSSKIETTSNNLNDEVTKFII